MSTFFYFLLVLINLFCFENSSIFAQTQTAPHPAVVRVTTSDAWIGSGTLIGKREPYGYVITNWHVVRDSDGLVTVKFPNGIESQGIVISTDRMWDLAMVVIPAPAGVTPMPVAKYIPSINDQMGLAGYGSDGKYLTAWGTCTNYEQPQGARSDLYELISFNAKARQGDSGGPIFNKNYEMVGVLFGSLNSTTSGSHCGRVVKFWKQTQPTIEKLPSDSNIFFQSAICQLSPIAEKYKTQTSGSTDQQPTTSSIQASVTSFGGSRIRTRNNHQPGSDPNLVMVNTGRSDDFLNFEYKLLTPQQLAAVSPATTSNTNTAANTVARGNQTADSTAVNAQSSPKTIAASLTPITLGENSTNNISTSYPSNSSTSHPSNNVTAVSSSSPPPSMTASVDNSYSHSYQTTPKTNNYGLNDVQSPNRSSSNEHQAGYPTISSQLPNSASVTPKNTAHNNNNNRNTPFETNSHTTPLNSTPVNTSPTLHGTEQTRPQKNNLFNTYSDNSSYDYSSKPTSDRPYNSDDIDQLAETEYVLPEMIADQGVEKYATEVKPVSLTELAAKPKSRFDTSIIIGVIVIVFVIIFCMVKTTTLVEEECPNT